MTPLLALPLALLVPWTTGTLLVLAAAPQVEPRLRCALGYGYFVGMLVMTLLARILDAAGMRLALLPVAGGLVAIAGVAGWLAYERGGLRRVRPARSSGAPPLARAALAALLALTVVRIACIAYAALTLPLVPVDAWSQWASKAEPWFAYRALVPFVAAGEWLAQPGVMHFTDSHPAYPATVPLLQVWPALWLGRWNESLVNAAWPAALVALALAFHGHVRRAGLGPLAAGFATYALLSLPFLTLYAALAGLADLFVASAFGLAALSTWQWTRSRRREDALLAMVMAVFCVALKREGLLWDLTLVPAVLAAFDRRLGYATFGAGALAFVAYLALAPAEVVVSDYIVMTQFHNVLPYLYDHLFVMDNWHLLWWVAVAVLVTNRGVLLQPGVAPASATMLAGTLFVLVVYSFTTAYLGVLEESITNRLPLQMVPALAGYLALVVAARVNGPPTHDIAAAAATPAAAPRDMAEEPGPRA